MDATGTYQDRKAAAEARVAVLEGRIRWLGLVRLLTAAGAVGLLIGLVWGGLPGVAWVGVSGLTALFIGLIVVHGRAYDDRARASAAVRFHERGLARLSAEWKRFTSTGEGKAPPDHPYADDLDIFGPSSLFQLLDATETPFGRDALAATIAGERLPCDDPTDVPWPDALRGKQEALRELAPAIEWRERLSVEGAVLRSDAADPEPFLLWAEGANPLHVPRVVVYAARVLPFVVLVSLFGRTALGLPWGTWVAFLLIELAISYAYRASTLPTVTAVSASLGGFAKYGAIFRVALSEERQAARLRRPIDRLSPSSGRASVVAEMSALERLVSYVDARQNDGFRNFVAPVLMWDLNFAVLLDRWRQRSGRHVRGWLETLGEFEALASLAGFAFDRPDHVWPKPSVEAQVVARGLGHPLLDAGRRVGNDLALPWGGTALVVTGSNMSGKTTLLRAIGVNVVLATVGAPVAAVEMSVGPVTLATSMRVRDSLADGVSHFYAEVKRLKRVVDLAVSSPPLLFLLDEILHGTNSRERVIGARAVITGLLERGALGAVSTHDLGIAEMAATLPASVRNVHFEEQVDDAGTMSFDYRLREGPVRSSNALRLMRAVGLAVPVDPVSPLP